MIFYLIFLPYKCDNFVMMTLHGTNLSSLVKEAISTLMEFDHWMLASNVASQGLFMQGQQERGLPKEKGNKRKNKKGKSNRFKYVEVYKCHAKGLLKRFFY